MNMNEFMEKMRGSVESLDSRAEEFSGARLDDDIRAEVAVLFTESFQNLLTSIRTNCEFGDFSAIHKDAHQIKGMAGTVGYPEISVVAQDLEEAAKSNNAALCEDILELLCEWNRIKTES